ncbi:hypothetical protein N665_1156s0003 [Sinapis alba]|nr:hypothetical protein N665_1156s0003 [Sinapis alba]
MSKSLVLDSLNPHIMAYRLCKSSILLLERLLHMDAFINVLRQRGDCGVFALKYIECHALGLPFPGALDDKNIKAIREQMAVDIFEKIPDIHRREVTGIDVNQSMYD